MHIATVDALDHALLPALERLRTTLDAKAKAFADVVMIGRTHLMDATPITLGQAISGWVAQLDDARAAIAFAREGLFPLALGGTAVGTGLNAHPSFGDTVASAIARETDEPFVAAPNKFAALSAHDEIVFASGALKTLARLTKFFLGGATGTGKQYMSWIHGEDTPSELLDILRRSVRIHKIAQINRKNGD